MGDIEIKLDDGDANSVALIKFMVVGKIISIMVLNWKGVFDILKGIWQGEWLSCVREIKENTFAVSFDNEKGMKKAIEESPWFVMGSMIQF